MFIGARIHHANGLESQALYGKPSLCICCGNGVAIGKLFHASPARWLLHNADEKLLLTLPNQGGHDFFIFFLLSAPN